MFGKYLTQQVDVLLTTRYHGIIFALSTETPVVTCTLGRYYEQKNRMALSFFYKNTDPYCVDIQSYNAAELICEKLLATLHQKKPVQNITMALSLHAFMKKMY